MVSWLVFELNFWEMTCLDVGPQALYYDEVSRCLSAMSRKPGVVYFNTYFFQMFSIKRLDPLFWIQKKKCCFPDGVSYFLRIFPSMSGRPPPVTATPFPIHHSKRSLSTTLCKPWLCSLIFNSTTRRNTWESATSHSWVWFLSVYCVVFCSHRTETENVWDDKEKKENEICCVQKCLSLVLSCFMPLRRERFLMILRKI